MGQRNLNFPFALPVVLPPPVPPPDVDVSRAKALGGGYSSSHTLWFDSAPPFRDYYIISVAFGVSFSARGMQSRIDSHVSHVLVIVVSTQTWWVLLSVTSPP